MRRTKRKITGKWGHWPRKWGVSWDRAHPPPTTPRRDSLGPWDPRVFFPPRPPPKAPVPQLMGLKGKGYRAGLSGNDRKKRGEEGGGGQGMGGGWALKTLLVTPQSGLTEVGPPHTFL